MFSHLGGGEGAEKDCPRGGTGGWLLAKFGSSAERDPLPSAEGKILPSGEESGLLLLLILHPFLSPSSLLDFLLGCGVGHRAATGSLQISELFQKLLILNHCIAP